MKQIIISLLAFCCTQLFSADFYETLKVGNQVYQKVFVLSSNASSLSVKHSRGIAQIALSDLESELQTKYGYNASADAARDEKLNELRDRQVKASTARLKEQVLESRREQAEVTSGGPLWLQNAFSSFGSVPRVAAEVDLRPRFRGHGISIRQQRGPSCSIHAVVAALEYQYAEKEGQRINVSETDLVNATARTLGRSSRNDLSGQAQAVGLVEEGFTLEQVFQAIRGYGLKLESRHRESTSETLQNQLRDVNFSPFQIPGARTGSGVGNIVHVLNAGMPVVVGVAWPSDGRVRNTSLLSKQPPQLGAGHAVTIVGYRSETGKLEDTKFIFRNSWGADWGAGGYGFFTYEYLMKNLWSCYVVELR